MWEYSYQINNLVPSSFYTLEIISSFDQQNSSFAINFTTENEDYAESDDFFVSTSFELLFPTATNFQEFETTQESQNFTDFELTTENAIYETTKDITVPETTKSSCCENFKRFSLQLLTFIYMLINF